MDTTISMDNSGSHKDKSRLASRGVLVILSKEHFGQTFIVEKDETMIGRGDRADFAIWDDLISREHCLIQRGDDGHFYIEDLQPKNTSSVNGKKLKKKQQLCYGDKITIGGTIMRFFREESAR